MATLETSLEANYDRQTPDGRTDRKSDLQGHELPLCPKIKYFNLKTREIKKKNKKKSGSNDENVRKLEPQQKQRVLIKKNECSPARFNEYTCKLNCSTWKI